MQTLLLLVALLAPPAVPDRLPNLSLRSVDGKTSQDLRAFHRGRPLVVHLWATWCIPCLDELPVLEATLTPWIKRGGVVLSLSVDRDGQALRTLLDEQDVVGLTRWDPTGRALGVFGLDQVPSTLVYDRAGKLRYVHAGPMDPGDPALKAALRGALAKRR